MRPARITRERGTLPSQEAARSRKPWPAYLWVPTLKAFSITEKASNVHLKKNTRMEKGHIAYYEA